MRQIGEFELPRVRVIGVQLYFSMKDNQFELFIARSERLYVGSSLLKSVSIRKPGGSRQGVIMLKSPIWL